MTISSTRSRVMQRYLLPLVLFVLLAGVGIGYGLNTLLVEQRQAQVASRGTQVMPFDLDQTTHSFEPANNGGVQRVIAHDPNNAEQIQLIRAHLQQETTKFQRGDFSDPASIHGADMPGLAELQAGPGRMQAQYSALPDGAQITYTTDDPALIRALHRWFDAQRADHGEHAAPDMEH